jgi:hypothetical protein
MSIQSEGKKILDRALKGGVSTVSVDRAELMRKLSGESNDAVKASREEKKADLLALIEAKKNAR